MTPTLQTCPCCGSKLVTWHSLSKNLAQAVCGDVTTSCPACMMIGEGDSIEEAIEHFIKQTGLTLKVEGKEK